MNKASGVVTFDARARTFSGGLTIKSGTVNIGNPVYTNTLGTGTVTLGDSSGSANARLTGNSSNINNAIHVAAGSTGELRIGGVSAMTFGGAVTLHNNLYIGGSAGSVVFDGGVTGTGNLIVDSGAGFNTGAGGVINMNGTISVTGTGGMTIAGGIGSNVTAVTALTSANVALISGLLNVNSGGTTITSLSTTNRAEVSGGTAGTGDLTFISSNNNAATLLSGAKVNHNGALIFRGTGTGNREIAATIGSNVTEIVLSGSGNLLVRATPIEVNANGTTLRNESGKLMNFYGATSTISGTGNLILKNNSSTADGINLGSTAAGPINNVGLIINSGTGSGSVIIKTSIGSDVMGVEQNSATPTMTSPARFPR